VARNKFTEGSPTEHVVDETARDHHRSPPGRQLLCTHVVLSKEPAQEAESSDVIEILPVEQHRLPDRAWDPEQMHEAADTSHDGHVQLERLEDPAQTAPVRAPEERPDEPPTSKFAMGRHVLQMLPMDANIAVTDEQDPVPGKAGKVCEVVYLRVEANRARIPDHDRGNTRMLGGHGLGHGQGRVAPVFRSKDDLVFRIVEREDAPQIVAEIRVHALEGLQDAYGRQSLGDGGPRSPVYPALRNGHEQRKK
jgi:hypothetical protein